MRLAEFKQRVLDAFGPDLKNATPANVREFMDQLQREMWQAERAEERQRTSNPNPPNVIPDSASTASGLISWESTIRDFFAKALEMDPERALIMVWTLAFDMAYSGIEEIHAQSMGQLFRDGE